MVVWQIAETRPMIRAPTEEISEKTSEGILSPASASRSGRSIRHRTDGSSSSTALSPSSMPIRSPPPVAPASFAPPDPSHSGASQPRATLPPPRPPRSIRPATLCDARTTWRKLRFGLYAITDSCEAHQSIRRGADGRPHAAQARPSLPVRFGLPGLRLPLRRLSPRNLTQTGRPVLYSQHARRSISVSRRFNSAAVVRAEGR